MSRYANFLGRVSKAAENQQQNQAEVDAAVVAFAGSLTSRWGVPGSAVFAFRDGNGVLVADQAVPLDNLKAADYTLMASFPVAGATTVYIHVSFKLTADGVKVAVEGAEHPRMIGFKSGFNFEGAIEAVEDAVEAKVAAFEKQVRLS